MSPKIYNLPFLLLIKFYQKVISPTIPASCRYIPTCSQYAMGCFEKFNPLKAFYLSAKRLLSCHPWGGSGFDPVP